MMWSILLAYVALLLLISICDDVVESSTDMDAEYCSINDALA